MKESFFDDFYAAFFASSPKIPPYFKNTDMKTQKAALQNGIAMALQFGQGTEVGKLSLDRLAKIHGKEQFNIDPTLYELWLRSLLKTIEKHDPQFSADLESKWREALSPAIQAIKSRYQRTG